MGQTLTHGIYLPDEGERNCYNGLAANWSILDGAVGTVAEHTSALAGKAPLVHTHTKSDITDFPALANVATSGSYNDLNNIPASFTPASHTHGNLTNDGKVGTTANVPLITGTDGVVQGGSFGNAANTFCEGNDSRLSDARTPVAHTHGKADITDLFNSANTWSAMNQYSREIQLAGDRNAYIAPMWSGAGSGIAFLSIDASKQFVFGQRTTDANDRSCFDATKGYLVLKTGVVGESNYVEVTPHGSDTRLGDPTNKWTTLNGVNPGALSIPSGVRQSILEYITDVNLGWNNQVTAARDGYIAVTINDAAGNSIYIFNNTRRYSNGSYGNGSQGTGRLTCMLPVNEGDAIIIFIKAAALSDVFSAYLYVMNGNVNALPSS